MRALLTFFCLSLAIQWGPGRVHAASREAISIVGSSTVYPFAAVVAERFGRATEFRAPTIESTGSGGGFKLFCKGLGTNTPDITNASRRIESGEIEDCRRNGVRDILEIPLGFDGIAIANSKQSPRYRLRLIDLYLALAKYVPGPDGKLVLNTYRTWRDVNPELPATRIEVLGPPPTSGTRDAFAELALGGGAVTIDELRQLQGLGAQDREKILEIGTRLGLPVAVYEGLEQRMGSAPTGADLFRSIVYAVREDGAYVEAGENDNLIVQKLRSNPDALGIFGFSFLDENSDQVQGAQVDGVEPSFESIAESTYPVSRPLYLYVKVAHVGRIPGIAQYLAEFVSTRAIGEDGYLPDRGLIPLAQGELQRVQATVKNLTPMVL